MNLARPHDSFFKRLMSNPKNVQDFLKGFLPDDISSIIDYETLKIIDTEKEDIKYKKYFLDLQIVCKLKSAEEKEEKREKGKEEKDVNLYIVFEHKSYPSKLTMIQILNYCSVIWERNILENKNPIPILPIVFYHGRRRYNLPGNFRDYFRRYIDPDILDKIEDYLLDFEVMVFDTKKYKDEEIVRFSNNLELTASLLIIKHIFDKFENLKKVIKEVVKDILEENKNNKDIRNQILFIIVEYIAMTKDIDESQIDDLLKELGGEDMPTLAKKWIERGREEGIYIGLGAAKIEIAEKLLMSKFGKDIEEYVVNVEKLPLEEINYIIDHIFDISLDEIKGMLKKKSS